MHVRLLIAYDKDNKENWKYEINISSITITRTPKEVRGYHCPTVQQPYWNTIYLTDFPEDELLNMIDLAYDTVFQKFSKKEQREIKMDVFDE